MAAVYASNNGVLRKELWRQLSSAADLQFPCCFIGDFNVITKVQEKKGGELTGDQESKVRS